jgi:hypothetical protein
VTLGDTILAGVIISLSSAAILYAVNMVRKRLIRWWHARTPTLAEAAGDLRREGMELIRTIGEAGDPTPEERMVPIRNWDRRLWETLARENPQKTEVRRANLGWPMPAPFEMSLTMNSVISVRLTLLDEVIEQGF